MSNKKIITQHRRGLKEDWERYLDAPAAGELLVEQPGEGDSIPKLKIGNGNSTYSELPYITDNLENELQDTKRVVDNALNDRLVLIDEGELPDDLTTEEAVARLALEVAAARPAPDKTLNERFDMIEDDIRDFVGKSAVNGLEYNANNDYMLYLTSNGNRVGRGVKVVGGAGGGGFSKVTLEAEGETELAVTSAAAAAGVEISFIFSSVDPSTNKPTGSYKCKLEKNGAIILNTRFNQNYDPNTNERLPQSITINELVDGDNYFKLTCTDIYGVERELEYNIRVIRVYIESTMPLLSSYTASNNILYTYKAKGLVNKTVYLDLYNSSGTKIANYSHDVSIDEEDTSFQWMISDAEKSLTHGVYKLKVYCEEISDSLNKLKSDIEEYTLLIKQPSVPTPLIAAVCPYSEVVEGFSIPISFIVYDPAVVKPKVVTKIKNEDNSDFKDPSYQYPASDVVTIWPVKNYPTGNITFELAYVKGDVSYIANIQVNVKKNADKREPEKNYRINLSSADKNNADPEARVTWISKYQIPGSAEEKVVTTDFSGFNWETNGWVPDDNGDTCLRISGGAKAIVNYAPFSENNLPIESTGLTLEFRFAVRDVNDRNTVIFKCQSDTSNKLPIELNKKIQLSNNMFDINAQGAFGTIATISCKKYMSGEDDAEIDPTFSEISVELNLDATGSAKTSSPLELSAGWYEFSADSEVQLAISPANGNNAGVVATVDTFTLSSLADTVSCKYRDNEIIHVAVTISASAPYNNTTTELIKENSDRFMAIYLNGVLSGIQQYVSPSFNHPKFIEFGNSGCTLDLYNVRVYQTALTSRQIVSNYISSLNAAEQAEEIAANNIYSKNNEVLYSEVKKRIPTITFTGKMPTYKGDKKVVTMDFENPFDPARNFSAVYGGPIKVEIDVQGTSSQFYVRKNWKIKLQKKDKASGEYIFKNAPYQHMEGQAASKVFCIKVDYAEATGTHNTQNANFIESLYDRQVEIDDSGKQLSYTGDGWIPPQKDLLSNGKYIDAQTIRTTIAGFPCAIFERETTSDTPVFSSKGNFNFDKGSEEAFAFDSDHDTECWEFCNNDSPACKFLGEVQTNWLDDFEPRYTPYEDDWEEIEDLKEKESLTADEEARLNELCNNLISKFKGMHDWVCSTDTIAATNNPISPVSYAGVEYSTDSRAYRLAKFKAEFEDYFDLHYASIYYIYTFFALMTDQRAKNMFLTRWGNKWYPYFYDNDTCFGINNSGYWAFDYYHEDIDRVNDQFVYNGQASTLWKNFSECFEDTIAQTYRELRKDKLTEAKLLDYFITKGSNTWSASIYNEDAEYKYVTMARPKNAAYDPSEDKYSIDTGNLYQVKGNGESHLRYFLQNRFKYCDSKWQAGEYAQTDRIVDIRINTPSSNQGPSDEELGDNYIVEAPGNFSFYVVSPGPGSIEWQIETTNTVVHSDTIEFSSAGYELVTKNLAAGTYSFKIIAGVGTLNKPNVYDPSIAESIQAVPPSPNISITPFSQMYGAIRYKANGTLRKRRLQNINIAELFTPSDDPDYHPAYNDTETAIFGPSELRSLGDLSPLYCSKLKAAKASRLVELTVGNQDPKYQNKMLTELEVGNSSLLQKLDISNCVGLTAPLDVSNCSNIREIYAKGSSVTAIKLPSAGYLQELHAPATITSLRIQNQPSLSFDKVTIGNSVLTSKSISEEDISSLKTLYLKNIGSESTDIVSIADNISKHGKLAGLHLENFTWENCTVDALQHLYKPKSESGLELRGVDDNDQATGKIYLAGDCKFNVDLTGSDVAEIQANIAGINYLFEAGHGINSRVFFHADNKGIYPNESEVLAYKDVRATSINGASCTAPSGLKVTRAANNIYTYTHIGWSTEKNPELRTSVLPDALLNIIGDRHLYPVFSRTPREYTIKFNSNGRLLYETKVRTRNATDTADTFIDFDPNQVDPSKYNEYIDDNGKPYKLGVINPADYKHAGWTVSLPYKVIGDATIEAVFDYNYYVLKRTDFTAEGDDDNLKVTKILNQEHSVIKFDDTAYKVTQISTDMLGIYSTNPDKNDFRCKLEAIDLSSTALTEIPEYAFRYAEKLVSVILPETIHTIRNYAFGSTKLTLFEIPASIRKLGNAILQSSPVVSLSIWLKDPSAAPNLFEKAATGNNLSSLGTLNKLRYLYVGWDSAENAKFNYPNVADWGLEMSGGEPVATIYYNQEPKGDLTIDVL